VISLSFLRERLFCLCAAATVAVAASGCSWFHHKKPASVADPAGSAVGAPPAPAAHTNQPSLIIGTAISGKVASVNSQKKFAVLSFPIGQVPPRDTIMVVYHGDAKTGEIRITGPTQDTLTVGDIVLGAVQENDDVRTE